MKLRHQIFLVSLCLCILPLGAWQYLKAVDLALRETQSQSLLEYADLIAQRLSAQPQLFDDTFTSAKKTSLSLYGFPLFSQPMVDGYEDEWRENEAERYDYNNRLDTHNIRLAIGAYQQQFYFYFKIKDASRFYFNPLLGHPLSGDYVQFTVFDGRGNRQQYIVRASAEGRALVHSINPNGQLVLSHIIEGVWREVADGYHLELAVDKEFLRHGFRLSVNDQERAIANKHEDLSAFTPELQFLTKKNIQLVTPSKVLQDAIDHFNSPSSFVKLLSPEKWLLAMTDAHNVTAKTIVHSEGVPWLLEWFYRQLLSSDDLPVRLNNPYLNYQGYTEINTLDSQAYNLQWYRKSGQRLRRQVLLSVAVPIYYRQELLAYVIVEKTTDQLIALTSSAFGLLFTYTVGAFVFVALVLLLYASWLSYRISRLNRIAKAVVNDDGSISLGQHDWPDIHRSDELGDLSRGYRQSLLRVESFNHYLRTLSSTLSHELRTPIAVVKSSLENIEQLKPTGEMGLYYQRAQEGVSRLNGILSAMSNASRIETSIADADFETVSLNEFLQALMAAYRDVYPDYHFIFTSHEKEVSADIAQELFVQMMDKLIDNAVDFSEESSPIVIRLDVQKDYFRLEVDNTGPLLPEAMQGSLFEPMMSVRDGVNSGGSHLGLGLYIVKAIVDRHGGEVRAYNRADNHGVIFSLAFPYH